MSRRRRLVLGLAALLLVAVAGVLWATRTDAPPVTQAVPERAEDVHPQRTPTPVAIRDAGSGEILVNVVDEAGEPVDQATVELQSQALGAPPPCPCPAPGGEDVASAPGLLDETCACRAALDALRAAASPSPRRTPAVAASGETDASGWVHLPLPSEGTYLLIARAADGREAWTNVDLPDDSPISVTVGRPDPLRVEVLDRRGRRLDDATLLAFLSEPFQPLPVARTAEGFEVRGPMPTVLTVVAEAPGYASFSAEIDASDIRDEAAGLEAPARVVKVTLPDLHFISGRVLRDGHPEPGAEVSLLDVRNDSQITDARGRFRFSGDTDRESAVWATKDGLVGYTELHRLGVDLHDGGAVMIGADGRPIGEEETVDVLLHPQALLQVSTVDDATGAPLAGVEVMLDGRAGSRSDTTGADGKVTFDELLSGEVYLAAHLDGGPEEHAQLRVRSGQSSKVTLRLQPGLTLRGRAIDADGKPLANRATVWRVPHHDGPEERPSFLGDDSTQTDADGAFELDGVRRGDIEVLVENDEPIIERVTMPHDGEVVLQAKRKTELEVTVLGPRGPVAGAMWAAVPPRRRGPDREVDQPVRTPGPSDEQGIIRVHMRPGEASFIVDAPGFLAPEPVDVTLSAHQRTRVEVRLDEGLHIAGRVVDAQGQPVAGLEVVARSPRRDGHRYGFASPTVVSGADGSFDIPTVPKGAFWIFAGDGRRAGYTSDPIEAGRTDVVIEVADLPIVRGRVVDPEGRPVASFEVDGRHFQDGEFTEAVSRGTMQIQISAPELAPKRLNIDAVVADRDLGTIALDEGLTLEGDVVRADGKPVTADRRDARNDLTCRTTELFDGPRVGFVSATVDARGHFVIRHLPPGPFRCDGVAGASTIPMTELEVGPQPVTHVTLKAQPDPSYAQPDDDDDSPSDEPWPER